ncbi:MAG: lipopolysaccharide assembly protein LapA domain-containing protein [Sideroxydans sp.]|nr:lipopolysaccharide assembly protein LapA domain-containing protein [Sideroxydans sp.]
MRYLSWLLRILLFIALLGFAMKNNEIVSLRYLFGYEWQAPLVVDLFIFLVIGVVIGMLAMLDTVVRLRSDLAHAHAENNSKQSGRSAENQTDTPEQSS